MVESESGEAMIDRVVDLVMRGQDPGVEALIAGTPGMAPDTRDKLRKIAGAFGPRMIASPVTLPSEPPMPFEQLGPYKLLSRLGEGGMGVVYAAEHAFLQRRVALKVIRPELAASNVTRQRFHREATNIAKLRHDNIVSVYDAGEHEGVTFLAMEWVEGSGLDELLRTARHAGERMNVISAARHARDIAMALQCAHDAGIIHRDVKPSNVRVTPDGRALLLDFGLSLTEAPSSLSSLGHFRGTPQYASPEQIESTTADLDARTDIYSLGITLYECLTGRVPFSSNSMIQLFHQILTRDPPEPRTSNDAVDEVLNGIVMRAIAKRRDGRFGSAGEMAGALDAWLLTAERAAPPRARSVPGKLIAAAIVLAVGTASWFVLHGSERSLASAPRLAQPVVRSTPRSTTALLGGSDVAFDKRLSGWGPLIGPGTFGADDEGPGVIGTCADRMIGEPHALPGGNGCVSGSVEPIALKPGERTLGAGAGIEFSDGRIVALLLVPGADGHELRLCELLREGESLLTRGSELESGRGRTGDGQILQFTLCWNDTDAQFDWYDARAPAESGTFLVPRSSSDKALPRRILLLVEKGAARFEGLVLEES